MGFPGHRSVNLCAALAEVLTDRRDSWDLLTIIFAVASGELRALAFLYLLPCSLAPVRPVMAVISVGFLDTTRQRSRNLAAQQKVTIMSTPARLFLRLACRLVEMARSVEWQALLGGKRDTAASS